MRLKKFFLCPLLYFTLFLFSLIGCKKNDGTNDIIGSSKASFFKTPPSWTNEDGVVCVILGYGFNSEETSKDLISALSDKFGLSDSNGLIMPLVFPNDFHGRISNLYELLENKKLRGIVILGAPEKTHSALSRLRDDWDDVPPFFVFSLFPQDDILGQEATCAFVIDRDSKEEVSQVSDTEVILNEEEEQEISYEDVLSLLIPAVESVALLQVPPETNEELVSLVQGIVGKRKLVHYTDSETGIQAVNHFILKELD